MRQSGTATGPLWFKDAIVYELPVKSFADGNNDGVGDFPGLIGRLDYLSELGVTCLWLMPFFPSPLKDDGYDISAYCEVHPSYGTLDDFRRFLEAAHDRRLQVVVELVLNHTSDQHRWFQRARTAPAGSVERDFYVWSDTDEKYREARIIFADSERSNWSWDQTAQAYYWHRFFHHQPDLNYDHPVVLQEVQRVLDFWLDLGVDGFRLDAVPYLVERDGTPCENLPDTHAIIKTIRRHVDERAPNRMLLAEANQLPADVRAYFGDGDECHMAYHFPLMPRIFMALHVEDRSPITDTLEQTPEIPESCQWALFLRNHDELALSMVTEDERDYMYLAYSTVPQARLHAGIRRRLAPLMGNDRRRIELLISLLFSLPGTPIIYYGDEIGMGDNLYLGGRHGVRTPMQWTSDRNGGFSRADPERLYSPVITGSGLRPAGRTRRHSLRGQSVAIRAAGGARSQRVRRPVSGGDARLQRVSIDPADAVLSHARSLWLPVVRAQALRSIRGRRRCRRQHLHRPGRRASSSVSRATTTRPPSARSCARPRKV